MVCRLAELQEAAGKVNTLSEIQGHVGVAVQVNRGRSILRLRITDGSLRLNCLACMCLIPQRTLLTFNNNTTTSPRNLHSTSLPFKSPRSTRQSRQGQRSSNKNKPQTHPATAFMSIENLKSFGTDNPSFDVTFPSRLQ